MFSIKIMPNAIRSHLKQAYDKHPGAVARSDARPPDMRTVTGSIMSFVEIGHEIISTAILSLPLKKGSCQSLAKLCALSTGKLPRRLT